MNASRVTPMSEIAIHVENLGKQYRIGQRQGYKALRDTFSNALYAPFRAAASLFDGHGPSAGRHSSSEHFWSLKDVSFDVKKGDAVGVIGRNGAGKSTLLKILSRITKPTEGYVRIHGRVGSLLEVGTGFHPELTGRENAYLNGAIIGMRKKEIDRKFDEIVAFAEIERFIDTPVKYYSSGMYVRLAFAVAAHLEPEILLVDEVLAVGDAAFQKKCLGKMGDVAQEGRTVLFVSHSMGAINSLTTKCIYLQNGQLLQYGITREVSERYFTETVEHRERDQEAIDFYRRDPLGDSPVRITGIRIGKGVMTIPMGSPVTLYIQIQVFRELHGANLAIILRNGHGERVGVMFSWDQGFALSLRSGQHVISAQIEDLCLSPGQYFVDVGINQSTQAKAFDVIADFPLFRITNDGQVTHWLERPWGIVHYNAVKWQILD
jgi:lipopolysaccharide transport system ATP-binding protein